LGQKSELQKALEKHKRTQTQKEIEQQKNSCRTPFERIIEERAKKIETVLTTYISIKYMYFNIITKQNSVY
jgi:uncharacterized Fe-S cluster-containing MiaB family protein